MWLILSAVQWKVFQEVTISAIVYPSRSDTFTESQQQFIWQPGVAKSQVGEALQLLQHLRYIAIKVIGHSDRKETS